MKSVAGADLKGFSSSQEMGVVEIRMWLDVRAELLG